MGLSWIAQVTGLLWTMLLKQFAAPYVGIIARGEQVTVADFGSWGDRVLFLKSIYSGTSDLIGKALGGDFSVVTSKFLGSASDESVLSMIIGHFEIVRVMNRHGTRALSQRHPELVNKYLRSYLAKSFGIRTRREIVKFHYQCLRQHVIDSFYQEIMRDGAILWNEIMDQSRYTISLLFDPVTEKVGDLCLRVGKDGISLYEMSFTIVPGCLIGCASDKAILVGRVQGTKEQIEAIKVATRACQHVPPAHLLMVALQAIAEALAIGAVAGVSNTERLGKARSDENGLYFDYDAFWETFFVAKKTAGIYEIPVPFREKPLEQIKTSGRRRTRLKRRFKNRIAVSIGAAFAGTYLRNAAEAEGATRQPARALDRLGDIHNRTGGIVASRPANLI
jgi:uncharacterized protein VirK/YbjX